MIQKQELRESLLKNKIPFGVTKRSTIQPNYERSKQQLIHELLDHRYQNQIYKHQINNINRQGINSNFNKTQPILAEVYQYSNQQFKQSSQRSRISLNDYFSKQKRPHHLNQYISSKTPKEKMQKDELIQIERFISNSEYENSSILNRFLIPRTSNQVYEEIKQLSYCPVSQKAENKFNNQSTFFMSKQGKQSPHRSIRFTEKSMTSQNSSKEKNLKSPFKLSISKVSEIEIRGGSKYGSIKQNIKKETIKISLTPKNQKDNRNKTYSLTNFNKTDIISVVQADIEPFQTQKNQLADLSKPQQYLKKSKTGKNSIIKKNVGKESSLKVNQKDKLLKIQLTLLEEKDQENSKVQNYNYDKQVNIFDNIKTKSNEQIPSPMPSQNSNVPPQIHFKDIKDVWHIKDQKKFKEDIQKQSQVFKERTQQSLVKKQSKQQNMKIFDSHPQTHFKTIESNIRKKKQKQQDLEEQQESTQQKFHFFNFLKDKLTNLATQPEEKNNIKEEEKKELSKNVLKQEMKSQQKDSFSLPNEQSIKADLSYQSSSSSFFKEQRNIKEKGIQNVNVANIVGQSVKIVSVNLNKISNKLKSKSESQTQKFTQKGVESINNTNSKQQIPKINLSNEIESAFAKKYQNNGESSQQISKVHDDHNQSERQLNLSVDFFAGSRPKQSDSSFSKPSTVKKIESNSEEKSSFLNQLSFSNQKEDSMNRQLFPNDKSIQKEEKQSPAQDEVSITKKNQILSSQEELKPSFKTSIIQVPKKVEIDLKYISLSQDAISFSKLQSVQSDHSIKEKETIELQSQNIKKQELKVQKQEHQEKKVMTDIVPKNQLTKEQPKAGKVRRIQIDLQDSSSDEDMYGESDSDGIDVDEIQDYDSDEEENKPSKKPFSKIPKENIPTILPPVLEEDLQESELKNFIKPSISLKLKSQDSQKRSGSIKQLQQQFLKDFPLMKAESEVEKYDQTVSFKKNNLSKEISAKQKTKIKLKPTQSKLINIEESKNKDEGYNYFQDEEAKDLLNSLKSDVEKLKNKIQSSVILDTSKLIQKTSKKDSDRNGNKSIQNHSEKSFQKEHSSSLSKIFRESSQSILSEKIKKGDTTQIQNRNQNNIDFDEINEESGKQLFKQFGDDLRNLKKKMKDDIFNQQ